MADISVIIPTHNSRAYLAQTLDSVLAQSTPVREILVIDDSSSDGTIDLARQYERKTAGLVRLVVVPPCTNSQARNIGLDRAQGQFIAFLDSDDLWLPEKLQRQLRLLETDPSACGAYCRIFKFRQHLDDMNRQEIQGYFDRPTLAQILQYQTIASSTMLIRRQALGTVRFDPTTSHGEDTIFSAELSLAGPWRLLDAPLVARRLHPRSLTADAWHSIYNTQTRLRWLAAQAHRIDPQEYTRIQQILQHQLRETLERRYWQRQLTGLRAMRRYVQKHLPEVLQGHFLDRCILWPRWLYRLRDAWNRCASRPGHS